MADKRPVIETFTSGSEHQTEAWGAAVGSRIAGGLTICLVGALGSGKTVLARGICRGLGVRDHVVSPSFILFEEYSGRFPVLHCDLYRLDDEGQVEAIGLFDRLDGSSVVLVEWGDRSTAVMEAADVVIEVTMLAGDERRFVITAEPGAVERLGGRQ